MDRLTRELRARAYLGRAMTYADELNALADDHPDEVSDEDRQMLSVMNSLAAIALMQVLPDEPGMLHG